MHVHDVKISGFRHLQNVQLGPFPTPNGPAELIVLAGPNGGGKSSVLELIGQAIAQTYGLGFAMRRNFPSSSFEISLKLSPRDVEHIVSSPNYSPGGQNHPYYAAAIEKIKASPIYYRGFNYPDGEYVKNPQINDLIQQMYNQVIRGEVGRSSGFFLRADRGAMTSGFTQQNIFTPSMSKKDSATNYGYSLSETQTRHILDHLIIEQYHYAKRLGSFYIMKAANETSSGENEPADPLIPYQKLLNQLFPGYSFVSSSEDTPTNLFIRLPSKEVIAFDDLSSGEREVFLVLSNFVRYGVEDSVIIIDEPELHLHPELSRILIKSIRTVMPDNQIWLASHNGEIIDEAGRDKVTYISRSKESGKSIVIHGSDETEAAKHLKNLFGYSGYIGISKHMVFLEGQSSSMDRKVFSALFPDQSNTMKFIPANSSEDLPKINSAIMSILESNIGDMQFYMIRDKDYLPDAIINTLETRAKGRMHILKKCHIENYLIVPEIMSKIQNQIYEKATTPAEVLITLKRIAFDIAGEVLRDIISFRLNLIYKPQDFSLENLLKGQTMIDGEGSWLPEPLQILTKKITEKTEEINAELLQSTANLELQSIINECSSIIIQALSSSDNKWLSIFPGKRLLDEYRSRESLGKSPAFENQLIKELANNKLYIDSELSGVIGLIASSQLIGKFSPVG